DRTAEGLMRPTSVGADGDSPRAAPAVGAGRPDGRRPAEADFSRHRRGFTLRRASGRRRPTGRPKAC
ncbi:MAG: hypothetical protein RMK65_05515, partial [Anaerolineae bacterium]|nr:hypothetical protein [Anaerolineae bacterium]